MRGNFFRLSLLFIPALFAYWAVAYGDFFYFILALIALLFCFFILSPSLLAGKGFSPPAMKFGFLKVKVPRFPPKRHLPLILILILTQIIFVYFAVYKLPSSSNNNLLFSFYLSWLSLVKTYWIFATVVMLFFLLKTGLKSTATVFSVSIISLAVSFLTTYLLTIAMANTALNVKIASGQKDILAELKKIDKPPKIVGVDKNIKRTLVMVHFKSSNKSEFLNSRLIPAIGDRLLFINVPREALIMSGDYLLITEINKNEIEAVSPIIGKLIVKQYLQTRYVKDEPQVKILSRQEYLKRRDDQVNEQIKRADKILKDLEKSISSVNSNIQNYKNKIKEAELRLQQAIDQNEKESDIEKLDEKVRENKTKLIHEQSKLAQLEASKKIFENALAQKDYSPYELGLFEGENSIKVVLESTSNKAVADFLAVLVHEYFHYTSFVSNERRFDYSFFEEGLTEYFARRAIADHLGVQTNLAYPAYVKIIEAMTKKIPQEELKKIYFTKNNNALISLLNNAYGRNFYEESQFLFETMSYASRVDSLKVTNNIMFRIDGPQLEEKDLKGSQSELK